MLILCRDCGNGNNHSSSSMGTPCTSTSALALPCSGSSGSGMSLRIGDLHPSSHHMWYCTGRKVGAAHQRGELSGGFGEAESSGFGQDRDSL